MRIFNTIGVEIGARCNRSCWFCPTNYGPKRPNEFMDIAVINSIADDLGSIAYKGRIELFIYNEPMLDKRLNDIIHLFRKKVPKSCIMISTNADLIKTTEQIQSMYNNGLNQMQLNIYSDVPRWREVQVLLEGVTAESVTNVYGHISLNKQEYSLEQKFDKKITPTSPKVGRFELSNRSGLIPSLLSPAAPLQKLCVRPFRIMQVNWKGEAVLCCNDYNADVIVGDVKKKSILKIWEDSKVLRKYRKKLIGKDRDMHLCDLCSFSGGPYQHFIEKFWLELKDKNNLH